MLPKAKDVLDLLEKVAPAHLAEPWDNPGLQVGSYNQEINKIFMALDPTLKALKSAFERRAQLLLTHHPLIFTAVSQLNISTYPGNVIANAIKNGISVVAVHTNLDVAPGGINDILAELLGLRNVVVLKEMRGIYGAGLGRVGDLNKPNTLMGLVRDVKRILGAEKPRLVSSRDVEVRRIAVVGGSGGSLVAQACEKGADLLVTGDVGYHHALEARSLGIALIDAGHFYTEKAAFRRFADRLAEDASNLGWKVEIETDENEIDPMSDVLVC